MLWLWSTAASNDVCTNGIGRGYVYGLYSLCSETLAIFRPRFYSTADGKVAFAAVEGISR